MSYPSSDSSSEVSLALIYALGSNAQPYFDTSALCTNIANFPEVRGLVIGLGKSFNGLGAGMYAALFQGFFSVPGEPGNLHSAVRFIGLLSGLQLGIPLVSLFILRRLPRALVDEANSRPGARVFRTKRIAFGYAVTIFLSLYLTGTALAENLVPDMPSHTRLGFTLGALGVTSLFLYIPMGKVDTRSTTTAGSASAPLVIAAQDVALERSLLAEEDTAGGDGEESGAEDSEAENLSLRRILLQPTLWSFFFIIFVVSGCGLMVINNVTQIALALDGGHRTNATHPASRAMGRDDAKQGHAAGTAVFVSLIAVSNCFGRLLMGVLLNRCKRWTSPRGLLMLDVSVMLFAFLVLSQATYGMLYFGIPVVGLTFGGVWALLPALCAETYGTTHLGAIYNFLNFAPMASSFVLASKIPGTLYDSQAARAGTGNQCFGLVCYQTAFYINAACLAAAVTVNMCRLCASRSWRCPWRGKLHAAQNTHRASGP